MARIEQSIAIDVPREHVWSYISVPTNFVKWSGTIDTIELLEETQAGVGTTARATLGDMELILEVVEVVENHRIASRAIAGDLKDFSQSFTLTSHGQGTHFTYMLDYRVPTAAGGKLLDLILVRRALRDEMAKGLQRLKHQLEATWWVLSQATM